MFKRLLKQIFCKHKHTYFERNIYGDEINEFGGKRSIHRCHHCDSIILKDNAVDSVETFGNIKRVIDELTITFNSKYNTETIKMVSVTLGKISHSTEDQYVCLVAHNGSVILQLHYNLNKNSYTLINNSSIKLPLMANATSSVECHSDRSVITTIISSMDNYLNSIILNIQSSSKQDLFQVSKILNVYGYTSDIFVRNSNSTSNLEGVNQLIALLRICQSNDEILNVKVQDDNILFTFNIAEGIYVYPKYEYLALEIVNAYLFSKGRPILARQTYTG